VLQCVTVCCSVLQLSVLQCIADKCVAVCCSVLQLSVLQCVAAKCVAVSCRQVQAVIRKEMKMCIYAHTHSLSHTQMYLQLILKVD